MDRSSEVSQLHMKVDLALRDVQRLKAEVNERTAEIANELCGIRDVLIRVQSMRLFPPPSTTGEFPPPSTTGERP